VTGHARMKAQRTERRRAARVNLSPEYRLPLAVSFPAQVLEINLSGVLLGSKTELAIGERGELRATVGNRSLDVAIEIRSVSQEMPSRAGLRYRIGAGFVAMTVEQRVVLLELLGAERN
jgi:hypothetical protein